MRKIILLSFIIFGELINAQQVAKTELVQISSRKLKQKREILIYTPQNYDEDILVNYDVIYVFDAQNREFFDFTHSIASFISNATKRFIVVGIISPYNEMHDYARNNDLLPVMNSKAAKEKYGQYAGNADNFMGYVKNEVMPFIDSNYRVSSSKIAIGHSLSASFIMYSFIEMPGLFNAYLAISPNLAYDDERISKGLIEFNYDELKDTVFMYFSNANEGKEYWTSWLPARKKLYSFLKKIARSNKVHYTIKEFTDETHWSTFAPALTYGLKEYFRFQDNRHVRLSNEHYEVTIKVKVPDKNDKVYITGNQKALGNWNPAKVKMNKVGDTIREITLKLQNPVELKITRGNWETEGEIKYNGGFNNLKIDPGKQGILELEILGWVDDIE